MRLGRLAAILLVAESGLFIGYLSQTSLPTEMTPELYCLLFQKVRENLSANVGTRVDPVTRLSGVDVICDHKTLIIHNKVELQPLQVDERWLARRKLRWSKTYCNGHPAFSNAISDGWKISTILTLADGTELRIDAKCHDAEA
jgi:hypothetical protein